MNVRASFRRFWRGNGRTRSHAFCGNGRRLGLERLESRALLTAVANLVAYRPVTEFIDYTRYPVAEVAEEDPKLGPGIRVNGDDDNANGVRDFLDTTTLPSGDNDLVRVDANSSGGTSSISFSEALAVWTSPTKASKIPSGSGIGASQSLWVEYVKTTHTVGTSASMTLTVDDGVSCVMDTVAFHSFQSVVIAIGGNSQDPRKFGDPNLGAFTMGGTLYQQGYDVYLYSHDKVQSSGRGAAYDEVVSAVLNRSVHDVAIFGYSWGGGATYELSVGLNNNTTITGKYELQFTAYVDGIRHYGISAERRLPVGTRYHDNFYQRKDFLLRGDSVTGANNINVTQTTWGKNLTHTTIDDNATLQNLLVNDLMIRVIV